MKRGWRSILPAGLQIACAGILCAAIARGQNEVKPQVAEEVFKNIQVLKGISVPELLGTMGFFSASLAMNCTDCHVSESSGDWAKYADDTPLKRTARRMVVMVNALNKNSFGGKRTVTCYSCHRGAPRPKGIPSLAEQYSSPPPDDPNEVEIFGKAAATPPAGQILDKYIQALGGAQRLASLTSFVAKGTYEGYDTDLGPVPIDIFARAPNERTVAIHLRIGDSTTAYNGRSAWIAAPDKPVPLLTLSGEDLDGVKLEADLAFPGGIKQALSEWRAGFPKTTIGEREVQVIQGTSPGGSRVKLFFDRESGLLTRVVRYTDTAVGINPAQIDYSDYREVAGVKLPFHWVLTWTDGRSAVELSEVRPMVAIDSAKFAKPQPSLPKPAAR